MAGKRGSKLNKSESVQVRFDPKLKMAAELLAARERRTLSSLTEWAMERTVKEMPVTTNTNGNPVTAWQVANECWDENQYLRIYTLGDNYLDLLTYDERHLLGIMRELKKVEESISGTEDIEYLFTEAVDIWLNSIDKIWPSILEFSNKLIDKSELYKRYQEARRFVIARRYNPNIEELKKLIKSDLLNQYPSARQILEVFLEE